MGAFGAIAEFHQDDGEIAVITTTVQLLTRATRRGNIRLEHSMMAGLVPVAYELSPRRHRWSQALALLPRQSQARSERSVIDRDRADDNAITGIDRMASCSAWACRCCTMRFLHPHQRAKLAFELRAQILALGVRSANGAMPAGDPAHAPASRRADQYLRPCRGLLPEDRRPRHRRGVARRATCHVLRRKMLKRWAHAFGQHSPIPRGPAARRRYATTPSSIPLEPRPAVRADPARRVPG